MKKNKNRILTITTIVIMIAVSIVPLDILLSIWTPRVSFTESHARALDDVVYLIGDDMDFWYGNQSIVNENLTIWEYEIDDLKLYMDNEKTTYFLLPKYLLVKNFSTSFQTSSPNAYVEITESSNVNASAWTNPENDLEILTQVLILESNKSNSYFKTEYYNELNVSSVLRLNGFREIGFNSIDNETCKQRLVINITNISPYELRFEDVIYIRFFDYVCEYDVRTMNARTEIRKENNTLYITSTTYINPEGFIEISIIHK
ncbi:MAG: hypothetical protein NWF08_00005 [Candidatus Bathyarchaeota archaeon]|nr:hypothetical protein [Candidatus Bathyarchaeota archaeon]